MRIHYCRFPTGGKAVGTWQRKPGVPASTVTYDHSTITTCRPNGVEDPAVDFCALIIYRTSADPSKVNCMQCRSKLLV